jgi:stage II sporulation protein E
MGRLAAACSFVVVNALAAVFSGADINAYTAVLEIFAASALFMAMPMGLVKKLQMLHGGAGEGEEQMSRQAIRGRMDDISRALGQIGDATRELNKRLGRAKRSDLSDIYSQVAARVCKRCGMRAACWQENYNATMNALTDCVRVMRRDGVLNRDQLPGRFAKGCCRLDAIVGELNAQFQLQLSREGVARKVSQVRSVVTDQFEGMSLMMGEIADELSARRMIPREKCRRVQDYFERRGIEALHICCYQNGDDQQY